MYRVSTNISQEKFKGMLAGRKKYIPSEVYRALRESRKGDLLHKKSLRKDEALKAIKYLMEKGLIKGGKSSYQLVQVASRQQYQEGQKKKAEEEKENKIAKQKKAETEEGKKAKHRAAALRVDIARDQMAIEQGKNPYDPRTAIGKSLAQEIKEEEEARKEKVETDLKRKEGTYTHEAKRPKNQQLVDIDKLPNMDID